MSTNVVGPPDTPNPVHSTVDGSGDSRYLVDLAPGEPGRATGVLLDIEGRSSGAQVRGGLYVGTVLAGVTDVQQVAANQPRGWVRLRFPAPVLFDATVMIRPCFHADGSSFRLWRTFLAGAQAGYLDADTYADGLADPLVLGAPLASRYHIRLEYERANVRARVLWP